MIRLLVFGFLSIFAGAAHAAEKVVLNSPSDTVRMYTESAEVFAFFRSSNRGYDVTVLFTEAEGATWRTRVSLADGQRHAILIGGDEEAEGVRISLHRVGTVIEIVGDDNPTLAQAFSN